MASILNNIKIKFCLKNIFDYIPYITCFKIIKGSRKLLQQMKITNETYKEIYEFKKITKPSYPIQKYFNYFGIVPNEINEENYLKERILCLGLNISKFNISLFIENIEWEYIIKNFYKINLIISPNSLYYLFTLKNESKAKLYHTLNLYKNHITQITICYFNNNKLILKFEIINQIIDFLKNVFASNKKAESDDINNNNINKIINTSNENNNVKKLSFEFNVFSPYIDFISKFFQKIDDIISLKKIEELFFDSNSFKDSIFTDIMSFITKKMTALEIFTINNITFSKNNYVDLNILFTNMNDTIEKIDLRNTLCSSDIISVLNNKKSPLKEVKLKLFSNNSKLNWFFLEKNINSLEVFHMEINENNNNYNINQMIFALNKMKKLKKLKLYGCLNLYQLNKFNENENLEYLNIDLFIYIEYGDELLVNADEIVNNFLKNFINLKSLILKTLEPLENQHLNNFTFPSNLTCIEFINFRGDCLKSLLNHNKERLNYIIKFKIENSIFFDYLGFINLFENFKIKNFKKLSFNNILFNNYYDDLFYIEKISSFLKKNVFYEKISSFLKKTPSLIELDISNNDHLPLFHKRDIFIMIKSSITKKLLNLKIFNSNSIISENEYLFLKNLFGYVLD